jgi:hypothetical protein
MTGDIVWGVCRSPDGEALRTVFCLNCREVFGRYLTGIDHMDIKEKAEKEHICKGVKINDQKSMSLIEYEEIQLRIKEDEEWAI